MPFESAALSTFDDKAARDLFKTIGDDAILGYIPELAYVLCLYIPARDD